MKSSLGWTHLTQRLLERGRALIPLLGWQRIPRYSRLCFVTNHLAGAKAELGELGDERAEHHLQSLAEVGQCLSDGESFATGFGPVLERFEVFAVALVILLRHPSVLHLLLLGLRKAVRHLLLEMSLSHVLHHFAER